MAKLCCPIELEPRTLKGGQINQAREVAADAAQKLEPNDATIIFFEGLRPVIGSKMKMKQIIEEEEEEESDGHSQIIGFKDPKAQIIDKPCQCTCNADTASTDSVEQAILIREPLSAPF